MRLHYCSHRSQIGIAALFLLMFMLASLTLAPLTAGAVAPSPLEQRGAVASPTPAPVDNLEDVQRAVVRIESVGVFKDPVDGMLTEAGSGTGFIIDPEGYVVTNNHVVTGAAFFRVYVDGRSRPVNARLLGVSECADLAVIDLQGKDYPYLAWYEQPLKVGLDIYAAGFPLGDPEYTLTRGIIAKARAAGETDWASVDGVIQHDAIIDHGNSGGPLVTASGLVVGVNYAGDRDANQFYAIGRDGALEIIEQLLEGKDVDSIGVNGRAFVSEDGEFSGIWVSSVASGSLADEVGLAPGDIILSLENLRVAEDGTMSTYCDILRSRRANAVTAIEVLRLDTNEILKGQLNGRPLQVSVSLAAQEPAAPADAPQQGDDAAAAPDVYDEFVSVSDVQGILTFDAPAAWKDVQDGDWVFNDEVVGIRLDVSPDLDNFYDDWGIPGAILRYSEILPEQMAAEDLLDEYTLNNSCTKGERDTLTVGDLAGAYQFWNDCGDTATTGAIVALAPTETNAFYVLIELYGIEERDFNAWDVLLNSLTVTQPSQADASTQTTSNVAVTDDSPLFDLVDTSELAYTYVAVEDPAISALIPSEYSEITSADWTNSAGEPLGYILTASPDIAGFNSTWTTPGMIVKSAVGMGEELDLEGLLEDEGLQKNCTYDDRYTYTHEAFDRTYNIVFDVYEKCGGTDSSYAVLVAQSDPIDQVIFLDFLAVSDADVEAFNTFLDSFYLDAELAGGAAASTTSTSDGAQDSEPKFVTVTDDTETISLRVPATWSELVSEPWDLGDGAIGVSFTAAPDLEDFSETLTGPGVFVAVSDQLSGGVDDLGEFLDFFDLSEDCTYDDRYEYVTQNLNALYDVWKACAGAEDALFVVMVATPIDANSPIILLYTNLPTPEDHQLFSELVNTLAVAGSVQSAQAAAQEAVLSGPSAVVVVDRLNVRSGPGTNFNRVGAVTNGEGLVVTGQYNNCSWLQIVTPTGVEGWVSGSSQYVTLNARCADIPAANAPAAPATGGTGGQSSGGQTGGGQTGGGAATASKGCVNFQNFVGPELTITVTNRSSGKSETFKVAGNGEIQKCFDPGRYTYTLDAPPPWGSTNGELTVEAGDQIQFPISPE